MRALEREGVDTVFGLVGHGNLAFVDALADSDTIDYVTVFHEQVAAHAADAYFRAERADRGGDHHGRAQGSPT